MEKNGKSPVSSEVYQLVHRANKPRELSIELATYTTPTQFQHINEYCLLDIFSVKSIDLIDLCALAETCKRFWRINQRIAPKKLQISQQYGSDGYVVENIERTRGDVERIFKSFGSNFSELHLAKTCTIKMFRFCTDDIRFQEECYVLDLVASYSDEAEELKSIILVKFTISEVLTIKLKPIFKRLQKLHLYFVKLNGNATLFAELDSLIELAVDQVSNCIIILENSFPQLERFAYFTGNEKSLETEVLPGFISRHQNLKTLELKISASDDILQVIGNNCRALNELNICFAPMNVVSRRLQPLQTLKSIRALRLYGPLSFEDFGFFSDLRELTELHLILCDLPKDSNEFYKLGHLTKLHIEVCYCRLYYLNVVDVVGIISRLVNLKELDILCVGLVLDETTFAKIVDIVKGRPHVLTLICRSKFKVNNHCDKKRKVILLPEPRYDSKPDNKWSFCKI